VLCCFVVVLELGSGDNDVFLIALIGGRVLGPQKCFINNNIKLCKVNWASSGNQIYESAFISSLLHSDERI
jgi:hypothetical protein